MEVLKQQPPAANPNGIVSVLIIVPQQTMGQLFFNYSNQLSSDFGLPHKAMRTPDPLRLRDLLTPLVF